MKQFELWGQYRVQSRRRASPSGLAGFWLDGIKHVLSDQRVNSALAQHPQWLGRAEVCLRPAIITSRTGTFAIEPDALYKREFFSPDVGSSPMPENIVDIDKGVGRWRQYQIHIRSILGDECFLELSQHFDDLEVTVANEYWTHEAGHCVGYDIKRKEADNYFSPAERIAWPLVYLEEVRADLHAFGFSHQLLPAEHAVRTYLYDLLLRFAVHQASMTRKPMPSFGLVPYLLFAVLREVGAVTVTRSRGRRILVLADTSTSGLLQAMRWCSDYAESKITGPEIAAETVTDRALFSARFASTRLRDENLIDEFNDLFRTFGTESSQPCERS